MVVGRKGQGSTHTSHVLDSVETLLEAFGIKCLRILNDSLEGVKEIIKRRDGGIGLLALYLRIGKQLFHVINLPLAGRLLGAIGERPKEGGIDVVGRISR